MIIDKQKIKLGESKVIDLHVSKLPAGTPIDIRVHVIRAKRKGPTVLLLGGVHGDEINGIEIVRQTMARLQAQDMQQGTVIGIPLLNVFGFINFSREVPDGKDINRSFPGSSRGSLASRVASVLTKKIIPKIDFALDFHTGGASRYNHPQVRFTKNDMEGLELAKAFAPPLILEKSTISRSFRKIAQEAGIPTIVYEGGESERLEGLAIQAGVEGALRTLHHLGITREGIAPRHEALIWKKSSWVRAGAAGIFIWHKCSGQPVNKGEPIGAINSPQLEKQVIVYAHKSGYIIGHNNASVVNVGDALFHIAYE